VKTYYASAERSTPNEIEKEVKTVSQNPIMNGILHSVGGLLAVVNEHRQVVALNDSFMKLLGIDDPYNVLGLRPGEVLKCVHSDTMPAGCGTSKACATCGAAIAMVTSLETKEDYKEICALSTKINGKLIDMYLEIKAHNVAIENNSYILLFIQDITLQQQRSALERSFFHDMTNLLTSIIGASELLSKELEESVLVNIINTSSKRLAKEIEMQRCISQDNDTSYKLSIEEIKLYQVFDDLKSFFINHPVSKNKHVDFSLSNASIIINTDFSLLLRILSNMITNALEASKEQEVVKFWADVDGPSIVFYVHNKQLISEKVKERIFQRNFSTKKGEGRGLGTFSMKLFSEKFLSGKVDFTSSHEEGTIFRLSIPK
jgi:K+-sensing histidine kinase KdpD